jgi:hypothetical protein
MEVTKEHSHLTQTLRISAMGRERLMTSQFLLCGLLVSTVLARMGDCVEECLMHLQIGDTN